MIWLIRRVDRSDHADSKSVQLGAAPGLSAAMGEGIWMNCMMYWKKVCAGRN